MHYLSDEKYYEPISIRTFNLIKIIIFDHKIIFFFYLTHKFFFMCLINFN